MKREKPNVVLSTGTTAKVKSSSPGSVEKASTPPGGTPIGWSLYSTALTCWRKFFVRYIGNYYPLETPVYFAVGTCYHALHEGRSEAEIKSWGKVYESALPLAKKLFEARMNPKKSPPLPKAINKETLYGTMGGSYTAKPDQMELGSAPAVGLKKTPEKLVARDFKTTATLRDTDDDKWQVHGEIIGEMVCSGSDEAVVDIISKSESPSIRQIQVTLTAQKRSEWEATVEDVQRQVYQRLELLKKDGLRAFPMNNEACVNGSGMRCDYYDLCHRKDSKGFVVSENRDWAKRMGVTKDLPKDPKSLLGLK